MKRDREYDSNDCDCECDCDCDCDCEFDISRKYILINDNSEQNERKDICVNIFGINGMLYGNFTLKCDVSVKTTLSKIKSDVLCTLKVPFIFHDQFDLIAKKSGVNSLFFVLSGKLQNILRNNFYNK